MLKKLFINFLLVAAVVAVLDLALGKLLQHFYFKEKSGLHYRTTYSMEKTDADILIFGSSRANHHYVPEVFTDSLGWSFYNTGRDGNGIFYQAALLKSILKRYTPKLVILDYAGDFGKGRQVYDNLSSLLPYYASHPEIRQEVELRSPYEKVKLLSGIYPYNSQILTIAVGNLDLNKQRKPDNKGYVPLETEHPVKKEYFSSLVQQPVDSNKIWSLREFVRVAKASGTQVVVIYSPLYQEHKRYWEIEICGAVCKEAGVPFWDYSRDAFFTQQPDLYYDPVHLNHKGALVFSKQVSSRLMGFLRLNKD
jgi:hypothetical protein